MASYVRVPVREIIRTVYVPDVLNILNIHQEVFFCFWGVTREPTFVCFFGGGGGFAVVVVAGSNPVFLVNVGISFV